MFQQLWQTKAFPNVLTTTWRVLLDRLPTRTNLIRRGVELMSPNCVMCQASEESFHHLFLDCSIAQRVWFLCLRWINVLNQVVFNVLKNPNPLKDVEASALLAVAVLV